VNFPRKLEKPKPLVARMTPGELIRFLSMVRVCERTGCWLWRGHKDKKGYGQFKFRGRAVWAHRLSYANFRHKLRSSKEVDHRSRCKNPSCVNPDHLRSLTHGRNLALVNRERERESRWRERCCVA
jgi:hypothetical protein